MALAKGSLVWASIRQANGEVVSRAGVVSSVEARGVAVVYGQGEPWDGCSSPVEIRPGSLIGRRLGLKKTTYFCDMQVVPHSEIDRVCPEECPVSWVAKFDMVAVEVNKRTAAKISDSGGEPGGESSG